MTKNEKILFEINPTNFTVIGPIEETKTSTTKKGKIKLNCLINSTVNPVTFKDVLLVPTLRKNLISVQKICEAGAEVEFSKEKATVRFEKEILFIAKLDESKLFKIQLKGEKKNERKVETNQISIQTWHERLGHLSEKTMKQMSEKRIIEDLKIKKKEKLDCCEVCNKGKQTRSKYDKKLKRTTKEIGEIIHSDVAGPISPESHGGAKYFVSFIDDFSRKSFVFFMKKKSEVFEHFKTFRSMLKTQKQIKIKRLRSDGGGEFISTEFKDFLKKKGITQSLTTPHSPQMNGVAERFNRTIMEKARCLLKGRNVQKQLWAEAVSTANFIKNRIPTKMLWNQVIFNQNP